MSRSFTVWRAGSALLVVTWLLPCAAQVQSPPRKVDRPASTPPDHGVAAGIQRTGEKLTLDQILQRLPHRVASQDGTAGDMVNFIMIGSRDKLLAAMRAAHWVETDRDTTQAIIHAIESTIENRGYTEMPMSLLYLFGRPQDYGFSRGMPLAVAADRHHFRLWEAPWKTREGETVWVGAGTHDIGVERTVDGRVTHQIDPEVDKERDLIAESLKDEDKVKEISYLTPAHPVFNATTATGDYFHSDGRILVIVLK